MTEKRTLRPEASQSEKPNQELKRVKRRKLRQEGQALVAHDKQRTSSKSVKKTSEAGENDWRVSSRSGGRFLDLDPVFSLDENYVILSLENALQVYSMSTSRIVRTLEPPDTQLITGCKLSRTNPDHVYLTTRAGHIFEWNWVSGKKIRDMHVSGAILAVDLGVTGEQGFGNSNETIIYTLCEKPNGQREISMSVEDGGSKTSPWKRTIILTTSTAINNIKVAAGGAVLVALAGDILVVGNTTSYTPGEPASVKYTWREVRLPIQATCFDIRLPEPSNDSTFKDAASNSGSLALGLTLGEAHGSIVVYNDILKTLKRYESRQELDGSVVSNKLHWHRGPVTTARWSKDGNYLISGGLESVLVLWQLDTGRKQFLPHLSSPISNLIVSPTGSCYAVKLADNSAMVLSTSDLQPIASMNGLQIPSIKTTSLKANKHTSLTRKFGAKAVAPRNLPAVLNPLNPDHLLLAVPSSSLSTAHTASLLQTFDTRSTQQVYRQAMARTNVSVLNTGPQGTELTTPDIKFIQISSDGEWLTTIDEWDQYREDVNALYPDYEYEKREVNREIHMKFWHWNEHSAEWELVTRINSPHVSTQGSSASVLDLATHPQRQLFATVGSDGALRIWAPDFGSRISKNRSIKSWRCLHSVSFENEPLQPASNANKLASLCFSEDGSVLAMCWSGPSANEEGLVYLVDPETGRVSHVRERLFAGTPRGCGFLGRYMIILSESLTVWDTVADKTIFSLSLKNENTPLSSDVPHPRLAINPRNQTFAVCFQGYRVDNDENTFKEMKKICPQAAIFKPESPTPVFQSELRSSPLSLLSDPTSTEFIIIDCAAQIIRVSSGKAGPVTRETVEADSPLRTGLEDIFGSYRLPSSQTAVTTGGDRFISGTPGQRSLTDIFDIGPSFALPAVDNLFKDVVDSFTSKTVKT